MVKTTEDLAEVLRFDDVSTANYTYVGYAVAGTADANPIWRIKKIATDGSFMGYPKGDPSFVFQWSLRTSYTYA